MPPRKFKPVDLGQVGSFTPGKGANGASALSSTQSSTQSSKATTPEPLNMSSLLDKLQITPITPFLRQLADSEDIENSRKVAHTTADLIVKEGGQAIAEWDLPQAVVTLVRAKKSSLAREGGLTLVTTVARAFGKDSPAQAWLTDLLPPVFEAYLDKDATVKRAASHSLATLESAFTREALVAWFLPKVLDYLDSGAKWQSRMAALSAVEFVCKHCPGDYIEQYFVRALPILTNQLQDFKPELAREGAKAMKNFMSKLDNQDITPRLDVIISALSDPHKVKDCVRTLSAVTFVAEVTEPALAVLVPILSRSLNGQTTQDSLRQSVMVTENLTRLVHNPWEVHRFIPEIKPGVEKVIASATQPEVRELGAKALNVLETAEVEVKSSERVRVSEAEVRKDIPSNLQGGPLGDMIAGMIALTVDCREFSILSHIYSHYCNIADPHKLVLKFEDMFADSRVAEDDEDGVEVVNAKFSLAYGGRMLLNKAILRLFKGRRYGLCGRNGCGKSTLMRAIAEGKLEGFPDKSEVRTCFVEHRLQGNDADLDLVSFIAQDAELGHASRDEISAALEEVGFDSERRSQKVGALSGGWKMKLELARAMLLKADVLLLDEPTNHLDTTNVKWLQDYLNENTEITSLIVSHDSGFLDAVCTDIIHYESKRLVYYKGNLSEFVKVKPEGKSYYTLTDANVRMNFPAPGILTGVRSQTRAIARMSNVSFKYPGASKLSLSNASVSVSLSSRVAVLGPNGAGKSTLIKLLTGELIPTEGTVEKHPNLRIGYIAQHALQHVELHKEKTPNQYIQWRYQNGDDREVHLKQTRKLSEEERAAMEKPIDIRDGSGRERKVEHVIGRQKLKKSFQYEIKWVGMLPKHNTWLPREYLIECGFEKLIQEFDDHEASREGLGYRQLIPPVIRKHFEDVGLDGDIADHTPLGSLSGGQLVKVVIAGATWNNPHLLVLDEPTNYLDRDSMGGLAAAIRDWSGGVILISHNSEFVGALCPEQWIVNDGKLVTKGAPSAPSSAAPSEGSTPVPSAAPSDVDTDSPANIKVRRKKKKLTRNEIKERDARRRLRYIEWLSSPKGTPKPEDTDEE